MAKRGFVHIIIGMCILCIGMVSTHARYQGSSYDKPAQYEEHSPEMAKNETHHWYRFRYKNTLYKGDTPYKPLHFIPFKCCYQWRIVSYRCRKSRCDKRMCLYVKGDSTPIRCKTRRWYPFG